MTSAPKTATQRHVESTRTAWLERRTKDYPVLAHVWDKDAKEALTLYREPDVGPGGEVVNDQQDARGFKRANLRETLRDGPTAISEDASIHRTDLLSGQHHDIVATAIDMAETLRAENAVEKCLAHQMALAHEMAFKFANKALGYQEGFDPDSIEANRCANTVTKLMAAFQAGAQTLVKLRTGGSQMVTVQHVNIAPGAQAVVGNVTPGGYLGR
jgi:hypothetical protein